MQIKLKKDCTYLTNKLEGLHVSYVQKLAGINTLQYIVKLDSDDEDSDCSSDGPYLKDNMVLDKDYNPIQTSIAHDFRNTSYVSDVFNIFESYDSISNNAQFTFNFLSSTTQFSNAQKINSKHIKLISMMLPS